MYEFVRAYVYGAVWAILPAKLETILDVLAFRTAGERFSEAEIREWVGSRRDDTPYLVLANGRPLAVPWAVGSQAGAVLAAAGQSAPAGGSVAVLPLFGTIAHRADAMMESSGGTTTERFTRSLRGALNDPQVGAIVIDVDSPGGTVDGVDELSTEIYRARAQKPIVSVSDALAASAAYCIGSSAGEMFVSPSSETGSIGVWMAHQDASKFYDNEGVKTTLISAGKYKTVGNQYEPLSDEARVLLQERVDSFYGMFVSAVARNRGVSQATVRNGFGEGYVVGADEAVKQGMADKKGTLDDAIGRAGVLMRQANRTRRPGAEAELALRLRMAGL